MINSCDLLHFIHNTTVPSQVTEAPAFANQKLVWHQASLTFSLGVRISSNAYFYPDKIFWCTRVVWIWQVKPGSIIAKNTSSGSLIIHNQVHYRYSKVCALVQVKFNMSKNVFQMIPEPSQCLCTLFDQNKSLQCFSISETGS